MSTFRLLVGDCREMLRTLPDESVHCVVTSPPYWGLRDYGVNGQLGLEETPDEYVARMVEVFREVRRVLRSDGTLWLNLGDTYNAYNGNRGTESRYAGDRRTIGEPMFPPGHGLMVPTLKPKDLVGIPWRVAFALQADGWYLRSDIIWHKPNPMPESVRDRPTKTHEYVFLLSKSERYFYDADAIKEPTRSLDPGHPSYRPNSARIAVEGRKEYHGKHEMSARSYNPAGRNARSVWTIATRPYHGSHFATFPPELAERCILAGCPKGGTVLDPFAGSGTTGMVATGQGRNAVLIELNPDYAELIRERIGPMLEEEVAHVV